MPLDLLEDLLACFLRVTTSCGPYLSSCKWSGRRTVPVSVVGSVTVVPGCPRSKLVVGALPVVGEHTSPSEERESSAWSELPNG